MVLPKFQQAIVCALGDEYIERQCIGELESQTFMHHTYCPPCVPFT